MSIEKPAGNRKEKLDIPTGKVIAGAAKNPDGTWDTSKAALMDAVSPEILKRYQGPEWQKQLEIPEDVQPGSAAMVFYRLRNAKLTNMKMLAGEPSNNVYKDRVKAFETQMQLISSDGSALDAAESLHKAIEHSEAEIEHFTSEEGKRDQQERIKLMRDLEQKLIQESLARRK